MAKTGGRIVGGVGVMEFDEPPHPAHPGQDRRGYVPNVFVEPKFRHQEVPQALMGAA
ncbi:MAG TPA: hypothetical protein PKV67_00210 [Hyphomonas sp.]|nr:hypothetical protein [Hyphomonas sp.]HRK65951.1 hypothetical protein [Hyphomonas sp.]